MKEMRVGIAALGLTLERGRSGHYNVVRGDGQCIGTIPSTPATERSVMNEFTRIKKRAAQEAGGRWV